MGFGLIIPKEKQNEILKKNSNDKDIDGEKTPTNLNKTPINSNKINLKVEENKRISTNDKKKDDEEKKNWWKKLMKRMKN